MSTMTSTEDRLRELMEFDEAIQTDEGISPFAVYDVRTPEVYVEVDADGQILDEHEAEMIRAVESQGWEFLTGHTGQHGYRGPIMHPSESIGGRLARDILDEPGIYAAVVVNVDHCEMCEECEEPAGWAIVRRVASQHEWRRGRLAGATTCARCGLMPLDGEDRELPCR